MVFKLVMAAAKTWRRLTGENQFAESGGRRHLPGRDRGHREPTSPRRLTDLVTQIPA